MTTDPKRVAAELAEYAVRAAMSILLFDVQSKLRNYDHVFTPQDRIHVDEHELLQAIMQACADRLKSESSRP